MVSDFDKSICFLNQSGDHIVTGLLDKWIVFDLDVYVALSNFDNRCIWVVKALVVLFRFSPLPILNVLMALFFIKIADLKRRICVLVKFEPLFRCQIEQDHGVLFVVLKQRVVVGQVGL